MFDEVFEEAWERRYGFPPASHGHGLDRFLTHRSVRRFSDRAVPEDLVETLIAAAQSASTSSNLQLWSVVSVQDPDRRAAINDMCSNQKQIITAPWFFAFFADHHRLRRAAAAANEAAPALDYAEFYTMAVVDAALAAERMVCAAQAVGLGTCYIGSLRNDPEGVAKLLNLPDGVFGVFGLCIGYPAEGLSADVKPRLDQSSVWFRETYDANANVATYDERMKEFYRTQNMGGEATWSLRSGKRASLDALGGRDRALPWLQTRGMLRR
ncbi:MAG: nitroreductase family protein [Fimbriimonas sp.]